MAMHKNGSHNNTSQIMTLREVAQYLGLHVMTVYKLTRGGRVLSVVALGENLKRALEKAYQAVDLIQFEGKQFRRDIGAHAMKVTGVKQ